MNTLPYPCWLCGSQHTHLSKTGNLRHEINASDFRITDANYGITADIYICDHCGFKFCPTVKDVLSLYKDMGDDSYEATRAERSLQARKILCRVKNFKARGKLLDVGAGSGILVEEAIAQGYDAIGVEPSEPLCTTARRLNLPVIAGTLPLPDPQQQFDVVTLIDVIEHVEHPREIMRQIGKCLRQDGICVLVTPDISSLAARTMRDKWWHYRLAHIGYFNRHTLRQLAASTGFEIIAFYRPAWYFPAGYLVERLLSYLPSPYKINTPKWLDKITIPLNLFDSLLVFLKKTESTDRNQPPEKATPDDGIS